MDAHSGSPFADLSDQEGKPALPDQLRDWWYQQEYFCEFVETDDQVFSYEDIQAALDPELKPLFGENKNENN